MTFDRGYNPVRTTVALGDLRIDCIEEGCGPIFPPQLLLPALPTDAWDRHAAWVTPDHFDSTLRLIVLSTHSWVIRTPKKVVLIDTCVGNAKHRPGIPSWNRLNQPYLERLAAASLTPEDVDLVMCTHLHVDHVGWNTKLEGGRWVPTFPNAAYLFGRQEYEAQRRGPTGGVQEHTLEDQVLEDSVLPVIESGRVVFVDDGYLIDDGLTIEAAPGHTEGHMIVRAKANGETGIFSGDVIHHPVQLHYPDVSSRFCSDPMQANATRRRILAECADKGHLLLPAHFGGSHCGTVSRLDDGFQYHPLHR